MSARPTTVLAVVMGIVCLCGPSPARAHEIGSTNVTVQFVADPQEGRRYTIVVVTDADALLEKLEATADAPAPPRRDDAVASRLAALEGPFRERVEVLFDNAAVRPDIRIAVTPRRDELSAAVATIHLTGVVPAGAARFAWRYEWTSASYALRVGNAGPGVAQGADVEDRTDATEWLEGGERSALRPIEVTAPPPSRAAIAAQYGWLGLTHIVPKGLDHMLFVVGLFLLNQGWRSLLWQISAFTIAHSITLGLAMSGLVALPSAIVEPLIAVSIVYVAIENVILSELSARRLALVFAFGLLHGMGFAGVLSELGLPRGEFATALVGFNVGVEAGQLLVIAAAWMVVGWYRALPTYRRYVVRPASLAIACVALYWTIERTAGWW